MAKLIAFSCALTATLAWSGEVRIAAPFADGMVLQREKPVAVWGTADPGVRVTVAFAGQEKSATAADDGKWMLRLDPLAASSEGRDLVVSAIEESNNTNNRTILRDVLVGEVWFASGQSNMVCPIWNETTARYRDMKGAMMIAMTRKPCIRFVCNTSHGTIRPDLSLRAEWLKFLPEDFARMKGFKLSAVAFYYALELYNALGVPIGIVESAVGGTGIDPWIPRCGYEGLHELSDMAAYELKDEWKQEDARYPVDAADQRPTVLWNGMVAAYAPMSMRGLIWYQGCSNGGTIREQRRYALKMRALYNGWSKEFRNPDLKLYFAMLAPWQRNWFELQVGQAKFAAEEPNAAIAVLCDVGNYDDIHPNDKEIVAKRLAIHALRRDYGFKGLEDDSPTVRTCRTEGDRLVLELDHAKNVYVYNRDYSPEAPFEIAGEEGVWLPAKIVNYPTQQKDGRTVPFYGGFLLGGARIELKADGVDKPLKCRYLYQSPWVGCVYADSSLPLGPFEVYSK